MHAVSSLYCIRIRTILYSIQVGENALKIGTSGRRFSRVAGLFLAIILPGKIETHFYIFSPRRDELKQPCEL
jgi:hypothetical protein